MRLSSDESRYTSQWKYVELARYVPSLKRVIREKTGDDPVLVPWNEVGEYARKHNETGIYTSVWHYNSTTIDRATRLGSLYFDLDSARVEESLLDARKLGQFFASFMREDAIRILFTGSKGFHIECEALALGITPSNELPDLFRFIAKSLERQFSLTTLDFSVYDMRRMWRLPNTKHQSSGLYKREVTELVLGGVTLDEILVAAETPNYDEVPEQTFDLSANEWYREHTYDWEASQQQSEHNVQELIDRFNQYGTSTVRSYSDEDKEFDPASLFDNCPSILEHWKVAEEKHHLEHEARLFLCSILTYSDEAEWYLHQILQNCDDYSPDITQAHINDWKMRREKEIGGRPYTCARANAVGVGCGDCELEPKKKLIKVGDKLVESEEYAAPSPVRYGYHIKK